MNQKEKVRACFRTIIYGRESRQLMLIDEKMHRIKILKCRMHIFNVPIITVALRVERNRLHKVIPSFQMMLKILKNYIYIFFFLNSRALSK
jgi:hypothetical protein